MTNYIPIINMANVLYNIVVVYTSYIHVIQVIVD